MVINFMKQLGWFAFGLVVALLLYGFVWNNVECAIDSVVQVLVAYW